jgi:predicted RNase H-like HicB family nuclease
LTYGILFEKAHGTELPDGFYYAHVPALGLTTHGEGVEGARAAALDLMTIWIAEKRAAGEAIGGSSEVPFSTVELPDDAASQHPQASHADRGRIQEIVSANRKSALKAASAR